MEAIIYLTCLPWTLQHSSQPPSNQNLDISNWKWGKYHRFVGSIKKQGPAWWKNRANKSSFLLKALASYHCQLDDFIFTVETWWFISTLPLCPIPKSVMPKDFWKFLKVVILKFCITWHKNCIICNDNREQ